jgi:hypothetical protein
MKVGFTGTRKETSCDQHSALCRFVQTFTNVTEWHHGACVGADAESVGVAWAHAKTARRIAHPPSKVGLVSREALDLSDVVLPPLPYLERNHAIVEAADILIACPKGPEQWQGSGTWATVRYARKLKKPIVIIWPDGKVTVESPAG